MENNLTQLAKIIAQVYRAYDEYAQPEVDFDIYFDEGHKFFETLAIEYADTLRGTIVDSDARAKALLSGMLKHMDTVSPEPPIYCEAIVDAHWNGVAKKTNAHGTVKKKYYKDDWIAMENTIYGMIQ